MSKIKKINKLEIIKYCNKNIEILFAMKREINNRLLNLLRDGVLDYATYDKIINVRLSRLEERLRNGYEPTIANEL